ncbi:uncharacterized protein LOC117338863 [Pecten maximus]|uniref:uncharacterized protein LOC117338863 n=1 Tax=Pecten maximus TaxID=6579 RepID=UPI001458EBAB|nr:uncharacterized protein LOC117338863 [Pecten maximus]
MMKAMATGGVPIILIISIFFVAFSTSAEITSIKHGITNNPSDDTVKLETRRTEEKANGRGIPHDSFWKIDETNNDTLENGTDLPVNSEVPASKQNSSTFFNKAFYRRLSIDLTSENKDELQKRLLGLNMWFPCGKYDRCRVGRNYCDADTDRCEICNSDICHGTNADSMCNFMCKEIPPPEETSTFSAFITSPVPLTTEGAERTSGEKTWVKIVISLGVVVLVAILVTCIWLAKKKCHPCKRKETNDIEDTSRMELAEMNENTQATSENENTYTKELDGNHLDTQVAHQNDDHVNKQGTREDSGSARNELVPSNKYTCIRI